MDSFFGIGMFELVMIAIIALVVLGPERLPSAMREVAKYMKQLRQISNDFQSQFSDELKVLDEINPRRLLNEALDPNARPVQPPASPTVQAPVQPPVQASAGMPPPSIQNAEPENTILPPSQPPPPSPAALPSIGATETSLNGNTHTPATGSGDQGAEAPR